jgi:hypothetical protein
VPRIGSASTPMVTTKVKRRKKDRFLLVANMMLLPLLSIDAQVLDWSGLRTELEIAVFECLLWARIGAFSEPVLIRLVKRK